MVTINPFLPFLKTPGTIQELLYPKIGEVDKVGGKEMTMILWGGGWKAGEYLYKFNRNQKSVSAL